VLNGDAPQAIPHLKAVLDADDDGSVHAQLARAYQMTGETEQAREMLEKSEEIRKAAETRRRDRDEQLEITPPRSGSA
jgi:thioredoxin-like negative regulator of GroEL